MQSLRKTTCGNECCQLNSVRRYHTMLRKRQLGGNKVVIHSAPGSVVFKPKLLSIVPIAAIIDKVDGWMGDMPC